MSATPRQIEVNELYQNNGRKTGSVAKILGIAKINVIKTLFYGCQNGLDVSHGGVCEQDDVRLEETESGPDRSIVSTSSKIRTLEQLLKYCKVDLDKWEVSKHVTNSWGSDKNKNFQVKAWLKLKGDELSNEDLRNEFIDSIKNHLPVYKPIKRKINISLNAAEIDIPDLHFGSLCWAPETGQGYDIKIAERVYLGAVDGLVDHIIPYKPEIILLPTGSDLFNVNSKLNITVNGTQQDEDGRFQKTFVYARRMLVKAIDKLRIIAPVVVPIIPGNHDEERAFYLGESLFAWYRSCDDVTIDNSPTMRKYWNWGRCLVGMTHGSEEVKGTLPGIMAHEMPQVWADTIYREWHTAHLHHRATKSYDYATETMGVRERMFSSLASTDSWHKKKGYTGLREATGLIWNKNDGNIAEFSWHP